MSYAICTESDNSAATGYGNCRKLARDSSGNLHVVWTDKRDGSTRYIYYAKSTDGGETWDETRITPAGDGIGNQRNPFIAIDSNDHIHIVWYGTLTVGGNARDRIRYIKYTDSWGDIQELVWHADHQYYHPSIAVDSNDYLHVAYSGGGWFGGYYYLYYIKYTDSWQTPEILFGPYYTQGSTSIAIDSNNDIHIAWMSRYSDSPTYYQIRYIKNTSDAWGDIDNLTSDSRHQYHPSIALDSNDYVYIVWYDNNVNYIKYTDSWQDAEVLASTAHQPTITVDENDYLHVFFTGSGNVINYIKYTDSWGDAETIVSGGSDDGHPIAIWANYPVVGGVKTNQTAEGYTFIWTNGGQVWYYLSDDLAWPEAPEETYSFTIPDVFDQKGRPPKGARARAYRVDTHAFVEEQHLDEYGSATFTALPIGTDISFHITWGGPRAPRRFTAERRKQ